MNTSVRRLVAWAPWTLSILFAAFIALFALDVFTETQGFRQTAAALLVHLIPTWIVLAVLAISWRREWVAGLIFPALAVLYVALFFGRFHWSVYLIIAGPLVVIGALFLVNWRLRANLHPGAGRMGA